MANINPLQIMQMLQNPQQAINKLLGNNPMAGNLTNMINNKDSKGLEQMARNLAKEKGVDADKLFNQYKSMFGM